MFSKLTSYPYFFEKSFTADLTDDILSYSSGPSSNHVWKQTVDTIARIPEIITTWILEYLPESQKFRLLSLQSRFEFQINEIVTKDNLPCHHVVDSNMIFEMNLLGEDSIFKPILDALPKKSTAMYLGYPIRSEIGTVIGVIGMVVEDKFKHKFKNLKLIDMIANQLSQELIRHKNENLISQTLKTASFVKHSLADMFRLLSSQSDNLTTICQNYLQTGTRLFGLPLGLITSKIGDNWECSLVEGNIHGIFEGQKFPLKDSVIFTKNISRAANISNEISEISGFCLNDHLLNLGVSCFMEYPILVHNQTVGVLGFYGFKDQKIESVELVQKVFELMVSVLLIQSKNII